jgi:hypothetical protein
MQLPARSKLLEMGEAVRFHPEFISSGKVKGSSLDFQALEKGRT